MTRASTKLGPALAFLAVLIGAALLGALTAVSAYMASPLVAVALVAAVAILAIVVLEPIAGIALGILAAPLEHLNLRLGGVAGLSVAEAVLLLSAGSVLLRGILGERMPFAPVHTAFALFIAVVATGVVLAQDSLTPAKQTLMYTVFLILSLYVASQPRHRLRAVLPAIAIAAGAASAVAIASGKQSVLEHEGTMATNRATAAFSHPNILGFFLVLALPVAIVVALRATGPLRVALGLNAAAIIYALSLTLSRGALIGAALTVIMLMAWKPFRRTAGVLLVVLVALSFAKVGPVANSSQVRDVRERLSTVSGERQTNPRLRIYRAAPALLTFHPVFGIGQGNFVLYSARFNLYDAGGALFDHAHNTLLTVGVETGFLGLAAFLTFGWLILRAAMRALRVRAGPDFPAALAVTAALAGLAVNSLTDYPIGDNYVMALVLQDIGLLVAYARNSTRAEAAAQLPGGHTRSARRSP